MSAEGFEVLRQHMLAEISAGIFHVSGLIGKAALDELSSSRHGRFESIASFRAATGHFNNRTFSALTSPVSTLDLAGQVLS
jgi:hypothetical protein